MTFNIFMRLISGIILLFGMQQIAFADEMNAPAAPPAVVYPPPPPPLVKKEPVSTVGDTCPCNFSEKEAAEILAKIKTKDAMCNAINFIEADKGPSYAITLLVMDMSATVDGKKSNAASVTGAKLSWGAGFTGSKPAVGASLTRMCSKDMTAVAARSIDAYTLLQNIKQYQSCVTDLEKIAKLVGLTCSAK